MKLIVTRRAARRIREIGDFIRNENPSAAARVEQAIGEALSLIAEHPDIGRSLRAGVRRFPVPRLPYLIYYRAKIPTGPVEIITVNHGSRRKQP